MSEPEDTSLRLRELLGEVARLMREHGARGEPVRLFIRANVAVPEFKDLACALVLLKEMFDARKAERELLGKGPECEACFGEGSAGVLPCDACGGTGDAPVGEDRHDQPGEPQ